MIKRFALVALMAIGIVSGATADTWKPDKSHSTVSFTVRHLVISKVTGNFRDFDGNITFDGKDFSKGSVDFTIQTASVSTGQDRRDTHLKSPDFFAVDSFPTMTFKSTKVTPVDDKHFKLDGDLTIRGTTKPVTFDCTFNGTADGMGPTRASFSATLSINRMDYGVKWDKTLDNGSLVVSTNVDIDLEVELVKSDPNAAPKN
ncbi:MAG: YceI family protein [Candidatus Zixiibacteriota bacterium]